MIAGEKWEKKESIMCYEKFNKDYLYEVKFARSDLPNLAVPTLTMK